MKEFTNPQTLIDNYIMTNITAAKTMDNICANMLCITEINGLATTPDDCKVNCINKDKEILRTVFTLIGKSIET